MPGITCEMLPGANDGMPLSTPGNAHVERREKTLPHCSDRAVSHVSSSPTVLRRHHSERLSVCLVPLGGWVLTSRMLLLLRLLFPRLCIRCFEVFRCQAYPGRCSFSSEIKRDDPSSPAVSCWLSPSASDHRGVRAHQTLILNAKRGSPHCLPKALIAASALFQTENST